MADKNPAPGQPVEARSEKTAGAFDIRNVIGALLTIYGVVLTLVGLFGDTEEDKTGGWNANLWSGLAMLVIGVSFIAWAFLRPVVVDEEAVEEKREQDA